MLSLAVKRWRNDCVQRQLPIGTSSGLPRGVNHRFDFIERHDLICSMLGAQCPAGRFLNLLWFGRRITSGRVGRRNHWHPRARGAVVSLSFSDRHRLVGLSPHPSDGDRSCWFRSPAALIGVRLIRTSFLGGDVDNHQTENRCRGEIYPTYSPLHTALTSG